MGWSVRVHEYVAHRAVCDEPNCGWAGTRDAGPKQAEFEAAQHRAEHQKKWAAQNAEWERA